MRKRLLSLLLIFMMVMTLLPTMSMTVDAATYDGFIDDELQPNDILKPGAWITLGEEINIVLQSGSWCTFNEEEEAYIPGTVDKNYVVDGGTTVVVSDNNAHLGAIFDTDGNRYFPYVNGEKKDAWTVVSVGEGAVTLAGYTDPAPGTEGNPWQIGSPTASNVTAYLTDNGDDTKTLHIQGTGAMKDFGSYSAPWYNDDDDSQNAINTVIISENITSIGNYAFQHCEGLKNVTVPSTLTSIGEGAFNECGALKNINIPEGVTSIGNNAFQGCMEFSYITIPSTVTNIGDSAFSSCSLDGVTFMPAADKSTIEIGEYAFDGFEIEVSFGDSGNNTKLFNGNNEIKAGDFLDGIQSTTLTWKAPVVEYPLWVGGTQVTSANKDDVLKGTVNAGKVSFTPAKDGDPAKLTLNGANITEGYVPSQYGYNYGIYYTGTEALDITLESGSENTIKVEDPSIGIYSRNADLAINGKGKVTAIGSKCGISIEYYGVNWKLTIEDASVNASVTSVNQSAVDAKNIEIINANVTATAKDKGVGIYTVDSVTIEGGTLTASGGYKAIIGIVKNSIAGTGWTDTEGTEGKADISVSSEGQTLSYKKVQFPAPLPIHTHNEGEPGYGIEFIEWSDSSLPKEAGSYCLMKDVSLSEIWNAPSGTTNLCLNGHTIKWTGSTYKRDVTLLNVGSGASLNLYDDAGKSGKIQGYKSNSGSDGNVTVDGGSFAMYGGTLQGVDKNLSGTGQAVVVKNRGKMTMAGGTITGYSGNGIAIASGGDVTVTGGVIADNGTGGISVDSNSTLTITDGEITRNYAGINIYSSSATVNVSGSPVIDGNINYMGEKSNLYFRDYETTINITDALTEGAKIGVKRKPGVFTKSTGDVKAKDYISYFSSDKPTYSVLREGDELRLAEPHTHDGITFAPWTTANSLPTEAGSYYLTEDVMIESTWEVPGTVNLCLNGHDIAYAGSEDGSVITVGEGAALNLYDCDTESTGSITGGGGKRNGSNRYGGGVYVDGGAFTMYGGSITGNTASMGAGVCVDSGSFTLNDGSITGNTAVYGGGGVYMAGGTFTMRDGSISENKASNSGGGGVSLLGEVAFTMSGGSITGNTSDSGGGGVYMGNKFATFTMSGGSITGNTATERGGGVSVSGTFNLSGNAKITGNTVKGAANNVCTYDSQFGDSKINVTGELTGADPIGVTIFRKPGVFTNSTGSVKAKDYAEKFTSDSSSYTVVTEGDELKLYEMPPVASVTTSDGTTTEYRTIEEAVNAWVNGSTLKLLADVEIKSTISVSEKTVTFDLNGHGMIYTGNINNSRRQIFDVGVYSRYNLSADLTLIDSDPDATHFITLDETGRGISVSEEGTESGNCIKVSGGYLTGGAGSGEASRSGGAVYVRNKSSFTMEGGAIVGNVIQSGYTACGAGVYVDPDCTFTMNDGRITGNTAKCTTNDASNPGGLGGGVYVAQGGTFVMTGGEVSGNTANTNGGGVYVVDRRYTYTGNTPGVVKVSGSAVISGNTDGAATPKASNVYLSSGTSGSEYDAKISVAGELSSDTSIGVTMKTPGIFTTGSTESLKASDYIANFTSDDTNYFVSTAGIELKLSSHEHDFTYSASGDTITVECGAEECDLTDAKTTLTIAAPTLETYGQTGQGISEKATLTGLTDFNAATEKTVAETEITYVGRDGTTYAESTTAPTDAGKYTAKITLTGVKTSAGEDQSVTATVDYEIEKVDPTAVAPTGLTATYGQTLKDVTLSNPEGNTQGTWTWKDAPATSVGNAGVGTFKAVFTPEDTKIYKTVEKDVTITVSKADAEATAPADKAPTYNGSEQEFVNAASTKDGTVYYAVGENGTDAPAFDGTSEGDEKKWSTAIPKATDAGTYYVWYKVVGDANHNDTEPAAVNASIGKRSVTLTSATASKEYDGDALTNDTVTVTGDGFAQGEGATYDVTGTQTLPGHSANTFGYTLSEGTKADNYSITKTEGVLTVNDHAVKYEIKPQANSAVGTYDGTEYTVEGLMTDTFTVNGHSYTVSGLTAEGSGTDAGTYPVTISGTAVVKDADGNDVTKEFSVQPLNGTLTINKRYVTLTSASASKEYDGDALTKDGVTVSGSGFATGEGATYNVTGRRIAPGTAQNTFSYTLNEGTKADNYQITTAYGTLTVNHRNAKYTVTLTANSGSEKYDGTEKTVSGFTLDANGDGEADAAAEGGNSSDTGSSVTFAAENGKTYTLTGMSASTTETDAGKYTVNVIGTPKIVDTEGNDETAEFTVNVESGTLTIGKRSVTLTSATDSKAYDGTALTNSDVTVGGDGFADGEGAHYTFTGTQTLLGSSANAFSYDLDEGTKAGNYEITKTEGTLTITDRTDEGEDKKYEITVKTKSDAVLYNGKEHTLDGFETLEFTVNGVTYHVTGITASAKGTDAGSYPVTIGGISALKVLNPDGVDLTKEFIVNLEIGSLDIEKRAVTLTSKSDSKQYDGDALTSSEVAVTGDGFADGEGAHYSFTGTQTLTGSSENTFSYDLNEGTKAGNYEISLAFGTLSVTKSDVDAVKAPTGKELTYNGQEQKLAELGRADGGEMQYALGEDADSAPTSGWSTSVPVGTDAGTYYVWYRVIGDANHNDTEPECVVSKISHRFEEVAEVPATCETDGVQKHWKDETGKLYKDAEGKEEAAESDLIIKATDHDWAEPTYEWEEDNSAVTATRVCKNDASHVETETVETTSKVTKEATESEEGEMTYTATFTSDAFKTQTKTKPIPKLDPEEVSYRNTEGNGTQWTKGSNKTADFTFKRSENDSETFSHFTGIQVDGKDVNKANYTADSGSVIVKLKPAYLETLSVGEHTLTALFDDGNSASAKFTILAKSTNTNSPTSSGTAKTSTTAPKTGDNSNMLLWITLLCASMLVIFNVINARRRNTMGRR